MRHRVWRSTLIISLMHRIVKQTLNDINIHSCVYCKHRLHTPVHYIYKSTVDTSQELWQGAWIRGIHGSKVLDQFDIHKKVTCYMLHVLSKYMYCTVLLLNCHSILVRVHKQCFQTSKGRIQQKVKLYWKTMGKHHFIKSLIEACSFFFATSTSILRLCQACFIKGGYLLSLD